VPLKRIEHRNRRDAEDAEVAQRVDLNWFSCENLRLKPLKQPEHRVAQRKQQQRIDTRHRSAHDVAGNRSS